MRALAALVVLAACAGIEPPAPQSASAAMAPLIGCWRGVFADTPDIVDERCFERLGGHIIDRHAVRPTTYAGETTYRYDEASGVIVWAYAANDGGRSHGELRSIEEGFAIAPHTHRTADGGEVRLRSVWTLEGADRLVMSSQREEDGQWRPFMRITFTRTAEALFEEN